METIHRADLLSRRINSHKKAGKTIGFVPTMGALHQGHLSLLHCCQSRNGVSVVSIFVNPTQFNDPNDLASYPRTLEKDLEMLQKEKCDLAFCPDEKEIYPEQAVRTFDFGGLDQIMEGLHRPGHFHGVAQVVLRLFDIVTPDRVYFGLKDFQQVAIIRKIVNDFDYPVEIVTCPTVREDNGLALSSRNVLLSPEQRKMATNIPRTLNEARELITSLSIEEIKVFVINKLNRSPFLNVEYFEIVDENTLMPVKDPSQKGRKIGCIAVKVGEVRLIDNIYFS